MGGVVLFIVCAAAVSPTRAAEPVARRMALPASAHELVRAASVGSTAWQLDVKFLDPQRITLKLPGDAEPTTFWYVLFEVTNHTGRDVQFYPSFRLVTSTLHVVEGGANISPNVYDAIAARQRRG